ncbi:MAG: hypothetical protein WC460_05320 [Patescibacteria group bacterium]
MPKEIKIEFKIPSVREILTFTKKVNLKILVFFKKVILQYRTVASVFLLNIFRKILADIKYKKWQGLIVVAFTIVAFFLWGLSNAILWLLFLVFLVYGWENRIIAVLALLSLAVSPILLILKKEALAEQMAVYAFFFLVMTVILQIIDYKFGEYLKNRNLW